MATPAYWYISYFYPLVLRSVASTAIFEEFSSGLSNSVEISKVVDRVALLMG
jgi:hypothetical protein